MKNSDLIDIIQQGENSAIEFKSADVKTDSLAKEIIAFANMNGGIILIGIEDDRTISGVSKEKNWESGVFHYDLCKVDKTSIKSLNYNTIAEYFKRFEIDFEKETDENRANLLTNTDILTENGEVTLAGLLVFGINPARYLFQTGITFVHYIGNDVTGAIIDSKHIEGDMDYIISTAFTSIKNNILTPSVIIGLKRVDTKEIYPDKVFRELITNCCAHRNYAITGSKIRILLFHNRIEFISPGKLPNTITIDKLSAGVSYRRNQLLTKFMVVLRLMDTFGRGLPNVIAEAKRLKKSILFEEIGEDFKVTLEL